MGLRVALAIAVAATSLLRGSAAVAAERGIVVELPSLGGGTGFAFANGINARGQVVGVSATASGFHAVLWEDGVAHDLGTLVRPDPPFTYSFSDARAINEEGVAVGYSFAFGAVNQPTRAVRFDRDGLHDLGTLGGGTSAGRAISERGTVVGSADLPDGSMQAFTLSHGTLAALPLLPDGRHWFAAAVNDRGQVAGSTVADQPHAVLFAP